MQIKHLSLLLFITLWLGGCSMQSWYEGMKTGAENECRSQQPGAAEDCLSRVNRKTYEEYENERTSR
jgi:hypothetical protein